MKRVNVLWALPPILPFALLAMVRLLWAVAGFPEEPDVAMAVVVVAWTLFWSLFLGVTTAALVGSNQAKGIAIWWTIKKEKIDGMDR